MNNCIVCSVELKFGNTPSFGAGNLSDGNTLCIRCFKKINKIKPEVAFKLKNFNQSQIIAMLEIENIEKFKKISKLDEIKAEIKKLSLDNIPAFLGKREISELPAILSDTEKINHMVQGTYDHGNGILVSTNIRLIFIDKGILFGLKVEDFPHEKISSIQYETGLIFGTIKISTSGNTAKIENVEKASARNFCEFVRNYISHIKDNKIPVVIQSDSAPSVLDQIEQLGKLRESGILTQEEFDEQKKKLLEKL